MSKRELRVAKMYSAEQKQLINQLKQAELNKAEGNLLFVAFIAFLAFISGV